MPCSFLKGALHILGMKLGLLTDSTRPGLNYIFSGRLSDVLGMKLKPTL